MKDFHSFAAAFAVCWARCRAREGGQDEVRFYQRPTWPFLGLHGKCEIAGEQQVAGNVGGVLRHEQQCTCMPRDRVTSPQRAMVCMHRRRGKSNSFVLCLVNSPIQS